MWFYSLNGERQGPSARDTLKQLLLEGRITPETLVWTDGMTDWLAIKDTPLAKEFGVGLAVGDSWQHCAYSGEKVPQSQMVPIAGCMVAIQHKDEAVQYLQQGGQLPRADSGVTGDGNLEFGALFGRAWSELEKNWLPLLVVTLLIGFPMNLVMAWLQKQIQLHQHDLQMMGTYSLSIWPLIIIFSSLSGAGINALLSHSYRGNSTSIGMGVTGMFTYFIHVFTTFMVGMILMVIGLLALCIGFFLVLPIFALSTPIAVDQKLMGISATQQSWTLVKPQFWRSLGYMILVGLIVAVPTWFVMALEKLIPALNEWYILGGLNALASIPSMLMACFLFVYYKALQVHARMRV